MNIEQTDRESAEKAKAPRVSLADIERQIEAVYYRGGSECVAPHGGPAQGPLDYLTVAFIVMKNGFTVIGKSAPAAPANFNRELGQKLAYEDAVRQIWPLMGFELRQQLYNREHGITGV